MKAPVDYIFPPVTAGSVPYWRLVLRGFSQLCFQSNELTGLIFFVAILIASPISAAYFLVAGLMAPVGRMLLGEPRSVLETGMPGLNPCVLAIALPSFFETGWTNVGMWGVLIVGVAVVVVLVQLCLRYLPLPTLVLPFLLVLWTIYLIEPHVDFIQRADLVAAHSRELHILQALLLSLGQALFSPHILSGVLFACGVLLSNWRHGLLAIFGAIIATAVAYYYREIDPTSIDSGLYGFNGVYAAIAVFIFCGGKLRLSILGALVATAMMPAISDLGVPASSSPFVFTTWLMVALGWVEDKWFDVKAAPASPGAQ